MISRAVAALTISLGLLGSSLAGPFDEYVGKYKGRGVEHNADGSVYYYLQTTKVEEAAQRNTATISGVATLREYVRYRANGTIGGSGSGSAYGVTVGWTITGTWRKVGDVIKGQRTTYFQSGRSVTANFVQRFKDGKLVINESGFNSEGDAVTSSFTGKLVAEPEPADASNEAAAIAGSGE